MVTHVRAPQVHTSTNMYVVVDCLYAGQRRVLFSDAPKRECHRQTPQRIMMMCKDFDGLLDRV